MADQSEAMGWIGRTVVDRDGGVVGPCTTVLFDDTGAPEWLGVDHAGVRRRLSAAGATSRDGRVRVELSGAEVTASPRLDETTDAGRRAGARDRRVMGALGAIGALVVAFLTVRWLREKEEEPPTQSERLLHTAREAATKAAKGGATVLDRTVAAAAPAAVAAGRIATHEGKRAGHVVAEEGRRAAGLAAALAAAAADEVGDLLESGAEVGHRVGDTLGAAPDALAESGKRLRRKWRKLTNRVVMAVALAAGYVLGSAAGRERYEQLKQAADKVGAMASGSR